MIIIFSILDLAFTIYFLFTNIWYISPILYILGGIVWVRYDMKLPLNIRPMGYNYINPMFYIQPRGLLFIIIWSLRFYFYVADNLKMRRGKERYVFVGKNGICHFAHWDDAIQAAKEESRLTKERVMISDQSKIVKQVGTLWFKSWMVEPDGSVNLRPYKFL
jgi:hypothetical protein